MNNTNWAKTFADKAKQQELNTKYPKDKDINFANYLYDFINGFSAKKQ